MAKKSLKTYRVSKRYEVWVECEVNAANFDEAVTKGRELNFDDFLEPVNAAEINDVTKVAGFSVGESW